MKKKYTYFAIIIILFIILYKLTLYFFNDQRLNNQVKFSDDVFKGKYVVAIDESKKGKYFNSLTDIDTICKKFFYCKFEEKSANKYIILMPYEFLGNSIKIEGVFDILPVDKNNIIEYQFDGTISNFTGDKKFPFNVKANLNIFDDNSTTTLNFKWDLKSAILKKVTNKFGKSLIFYTVEQLQSSTFKKISSDINKNWIFY